MHMTMIMHDPCLPGNMTYVKVQKLLSIGHVFWPVTFGYIHNNSLNYVEISFSPVCCVIQNLFRKERMVPALIIKLQSLCFV